MTHKEVDDWLVNIADITKNLPEKIRAELDYLITEVVYEARSVGYDDGWADGKDDAFQTMDER